ncbi:hypothetical protein [Nocardia niwae]|uniref:Uncharacterized protein n=1 Tax=Nocardia niwae TaxID=626084 RepID=A0ABV2X3K2_9NOCA|nr:hypothetical protein [Nocardia niwae]
MLDTGRTYGDLIREVANAYRDRARRIVEADGLGSEAVRQAASLSAANAVWLQGRVWVPKSERDARMARGETQVPLTVLRFRTDSVRYSLLHDAGGNPIGLSLDSKSDDAGKRTAWARAADRRGEREYEIASDADQRSWVGDRGWIDRSNVARVPAPWYHPDRHGEPIFLGGHSGPHRFVMRADETYTMSGEPMGSQIISVNGQTLGIHLVTNPDFWLISESRGGDITFHSACNPGGYGDHVSSSTRHDGEFGSDFGPRDRSGTTLRLAASVLHEHGVDVPVHGATSTTWTYANHPDGMPQGEPTPGSTRDVDWDPEPTLSSIVVMPGKDADGDSAPGTFVTIPPPSAGGTIQHER